MLKRTKNVLELSITEHGAAGSNAVLFPARWPNNLTDLNHVLEMLTMGQGTADDMLALIIFPSSKVMIKSTPYYLYWLTCVVIFD